MAAAGIRVIQIDETALREGCRCAGRLAWYLEWR